MAELWGGVELDKEASTKCYSVLGMQVPFGMLAKAWNYISMCLGNGLFSLSAATVEMGYKLDGLCCHWGFPALGPGASFTHLVSSSHSNIVRLGLGIPSYR